MYIYGKYSQDSVHVQGPMTNSKYVLGMGTGKWISPYNVTSPKDCLNLQTVKVGDSLFITHHFILIIRHV